MRVGSQKSKSPSNSRRAPHVEGNSNTTSSISTTWAQKHWLAGAVPDGLKRPLAPWQTAHNGGIRCVPDEKLHGTEDSAKTFTLRNSASAPRPRDCWHSTFGGQLFSTSRTENRGVGSEPFRGWPTFSSCDPRKRRKRQMTSAVRERSGSK